MWPASFRALSEVLIFIMKATDDKVYTHALQERILWKRRNEEVYHRITRANVKTAAKYAVLGFRWDRVEKGYVLPM
jgi:hypothetical protein